MARFPAGDSNILTLLKESKTIYVIPKYQRSYAWEEQPQLSDLWDDICETIINRDEELFTGTIILSKTDTKLIGDVSEELYYKDVIDGQQRLTTVLILLRALYDSFSDQRKEWARNNIYKPYFLATEGEYKLRLSEKDNKFFEDFVLDIENLHTPRRNGRGQNPSEKRLNKALAFFKSKIKEAAGDDVDTYAEDFFNKLKDNLAIVLIEARSDVDAYTIFETINSKNRALTPSELLKNYFFSVASQSPALLKKIISQWESVADELVAKEIDITEFIRHYWISKHEGKVSEKRLYRAIKDEIKRDQSEAAAFVNSLKMEVSIYTEIASPPESTKDDEEKYFGQLQELGIRQCYPLILAIKATGYENLIPILKQIIFISLRRSITDRNPNELEKLYSQYSYQIRQNGDAKILEFVDKLKEKDITDEQFEEALVIANLSMKMAKFILLRLEDIKRTGETRLHPRDVEVEHIMPGTPERLEDWNVTREKHKEWLETLGNKTLIGPTFNKKVSNKSFDVKRPVYKVSEIKMTAELSKHYSKWSIDIIEQRSKILAKELVKIYS